MLAEVEEVMKELIDSRPNSRLCQSRHSNNDIAGRDCDALILGSLIGAMSQEGLFPLPEPKKFTQSASTLASWIDSMQANIFSSDEGGSYHHRGTVHKECNPSDRLGTAIKQIMDNIPSIVTDLHRQHLKAQAKKSGIDG
jgi:hypothetical protein